ncbi:RNA-binding domain-containing protein [Patellaria atrata CBS 101060]|uniref:RNA-binding domain-containing protein n=1 Tax=Patellaria atrata CBS 101060 TaxID=1346257 RepID=A0A9P4S466_9PEZI|nr:RNA-binding domain-containing protein [Patellaria atrata CBS 101060]
MAYPPPPGFQNSQGNKTTPSTLHPSLPARPPPTVNSLPASKPGINLSKNQTSTGYAAFTSFTPRSVAAQNASWNPNPPTVAQQPYYQTPSQEAYAQPTPPQIRNPFAPPGQNGAGRGQGYDGFGLDEEASQIAQWQSAYMPSADGGKSAGKGRGEGAASAGGANAIPLGNQRSIAPPTHAEVNSLANSESASALTTSGPDGKRKTVVRSGGGATWQDDTLLEWDPNHFRIFVGNLAGEVTDDSLYKAFSKYPSIQKARVVRDKKTTKSKAYGFVSFSDGDDYFLAVKEMNGKYIGSHPVTIKRAETKIKAVTVKDQKHNNNKRHHGNGSSVQNKHSNAAGSVTGAGISKKQPKERNGLKILG